MRVNFSVFFAIGLLVVIECGSSLHPMGIASAYADQGRQSDVVHQGDALDGIAYSRSLKLAGAGAQG